MYEHFAHCGLSKYVKVYCCLSCCFLNFRFNSLPLSSIATIQSLQSFFASASLSLGNNSKHFLFTYCIIFGSSWSFPLPRTFDRIRVSASTNSLTNAAASDLLVLNFIMMGHSRLGWSNSSPYTEQTNKK